MHAGFVPHLLCIYVVMDHVSTVSVDRFYYILTCLVQPKHIHSAGWSESDEHLRRRCGDLSRPIMEVAARDHP